jgi:hypothetical protein
MRRASGRYLQNLYAYVGYKIDNDVGSVAGNPKLGVLGTQGFIGVCTASAGCELVAADQTSGVKIFPGALSQTGTNRYLVTGRPAACGKLDNATDLQIWGQCIEVSVDPKKDPSFTFQAVTPGPMLVQTCLVPGAAAYLSDARVVLPDGQGPRIRLAQLSEGKPVALRARPPHTEDTGDDRKGDYSGGFFQASCNLATLGALSAPSRTATDYAMRWFTRTTTRVFELLEPKPAHAGHGGLGSFGFTGSSSIFGPADPFAFQGSFGADVPGLRPKTDDLGRATWAIEAQSPGNVIVRAAPLSGFPQSAGNVAEINQAGGAADSKQGLRMLANLAHFDGSESSAGARANTGKYRVRWTSLVATPRAGGTQGAPFVALGVAPADTAATLARFVYVNGQGAQGGTISFAGAAVSGLTWQQGVRQRFELLIDLGAGTATLRSVNLGTGASSATNALVQSFPAGTTLEQVGWVLGALDNQVLVMDDFEIVRLADDYAPSEP